MAGAPRRPAMPPKAPPKEQYFCTACGGNWTAVASHYYKSKLPAYNANRGYINVCKACLEKEYNEVVEFLDGDEIRAIKYMCGRYGWYFDLSVCRSLQRKKGESLFRTYIEQMQHATGKLAKKTYLDSVKEELSVKIDQLDEWQGDDAIDEVTDEMKLRWGSQFTPDEVLMLDRHYRMLHKYNPDCSGNQENAIKDLCYTNMLKMQAVQEKDTDMLTKLITSYQKTFSAAGLQMASEDDNKQNDDTFGVTLSLISQITPEEYYKDKELFKDYSGIDEYMQRHVVRPMRNIILGTTDRDPEFHVPGDMPELDGGDRNG